MKYIKNLFMTRYEKLLYHINIAKKRGLIVQLDNGITLDFENGVILDSDGRQCKCIYR